MRFGDYLRLGVAGILAQKRRVVLVVSVVAALMSVLIAGCLIIQGVEDAALEEMTRVTNGKVLLSVSVDARICGEGCDVEAEEQKLKEKIRGYGGEVIEAETVANADGMFYRVTGDDLGLFGRSGFSDLTEVPEGETAVLVSMSTAARWLGIGMYAPSLKAEDMVKIAERIRNEAVGKIVETENGGRYYIVDLLPGGAFTGALGVSRRDDYNPLDLVLEQVETGGGQNFVVSGKVDGIETEALLAEFPGVEKAEEFMRDPENDCTEAGWMLGECGEDYRYQVTEVISSPVATRRNMRGIWVVYGVVCVVLMIIVVAIEVGTYTRLIGQDTKTIALYYAMGAMRRQIRGVYMVYLLLLSVIAVVVAGVIGVGLAMIVSMVNGEVLTQAFVLGFGIEAKRIWLVGWSWQIIVMMGVVLMMVPLVVLCNAKQFTSKKLAQKLK